MISQDLSEFALHARALLGLPVPEIRFYGPSASRAVVIEGDTNRMEMGGIEQVLEEPGTQMRIFGQARSVRTPPHGCYTCHRRYR